MKARKSWTAKLTNGHDLPKIVPLPVKMRSRLGKGAMVVPAPLEVDAVIRQVPKGKLITINEIRAILARKHGVACACPIVTGIGAWLASHAAEEQATLGKKRITPWWRTLKAGGILNEKFPGGVKNHKQHLKAEGHTVVPRGSKWQVEDFEKRLFSQLILKAN